MLGTSRLFRTSLSRHTERAAGVRLDTTAATLINRNLDSSVRCTSVAGIQPRRELHCFEWVILSLFGPFGRPVKGDLQGIGRVAGLLFGTAHFHDG